MNDRPTPPKIFKVVETDGGWSVEHDGTVSHRSVDKADAVAAATRLARAALGIGQAAQVRIQGESYF